MDAEVVSVLRRGVLSGRLEEARARMVIADLTHWPVDRISPLPDGVGLAAPPECQRL